MLISPQYLNILIFFSIKKSKWNKLKKNSEDSIDRKKIEKLHMKE